jgi:GAF domain-containing protein
MIRLLRRFLKVHYNYNDPHDQQRASRLLLTSIILSVVWIVLLITLSAPTLVNGERPISTVEVIAFILPVLSLLIYYAVQRGRLGLATWLFLGALYAATVPSAVAALNLPVLLLIPTIAAGVLLDRRQFSVMLVLIAGALLLHAYVQSGVTQSSIVVPARNVVPDLVIMLIALAPAAFLFYTLSGSAQKVTAASAEDIRHYRVGSSFYASEDEESLLSNGLRVIQNELDYAAVQMFLVNNDGSPQRRIRLGIGQSELTSSVIVNPGNAAVIHEIVNTREAVLVTAHEGQPRRGHLSAGSQRAFVVPIMNADHVFGVLDIQSAYEQSFSSNQADALRLFGQRLGAALAKARLIADLRQSLREREDAAAYMRTQLIETQGRSRQIVQSGWRNYLQSRGELFGYDLKGQAGSIVPAADLPPEIRAALQRGDVYVEARRDEQIINAPIVFRGEVLGAMSFAVSAERGIAERDLEIVRAVTNRLGVALESNRLLEQTQAQARRERKASEVAKTLLAATSIESLMELAADQFNEALDAIYTRIYLEPGVAADAPAERGEPA